MTINRTRNTQHKQSIVRFASRLLSTAKFYWPIPAPKECVHFIYSVFFFFFFRTIKPKRMYEKNNNNVCFILTQMNDILSNNAFFFFYNAHLFNCRLFTANCCYLSLSFPYKEIRSTKIIIMREELHLRIFHMF